MHNSVSDYLVHNPHPAWDKNMLLLYFRKNYTVYCLIFYVFSSSSNHSNGKLSFLICTLIKVCESVSVDQNQNIICRENRFHWQWQESVWWKTSCQHLLTIHTTNTLLAKCIFIPAFFCLILRVQRSDCGLKTLCGRKEYWFQVVDAFNLNVTWSQLV